MAVDVGSQETMVVRMSHDLDLDRSSAVVHEITGGIAVAVVVVIVKNHRRATATIRVLVLIVGGRERK